MPENPYTRSVTVEVTELTPQHGNLPTCHAMLADGARCAFRAKWKMNDRPLCGVHLRPATVFFPERMIRG